LKKKDFICFQKVTLAVSKVRHLPHLPPLRYGHELLLQPLPSQTKIKKHTRTVMERTIRKRKTMAMKGKPV
jgi:hypothetical protein